MLFSSFLLPDPAWSQARNQRKTQAQKKKTVGELLSQAQEASRGGRVQIQKGASQLPKSNLTFKQPITPVNLNQVKPAPSSIIVRGTEDRSDRAQYERAQERQMQEMFKLTQKFAKSPNRGEYWLRLAELYVERGAIVNSRLQAEYDQKMIPFNEGKTKRRPKLNVNSAHEYNRKAIQLYEWFVRDFPRDQKISQAYYFLGYNYFEMGNAERGSQYYKELVQKFPNSPFSKEAHFGLGEYYFDKEDWNQAYKQYSILIKEKRHKLHTFSLYKGAWCLFKLAKYKDALSYMEYILKTGRADDGGELASKRVVNRTKLESEALRDIVVFYAHIREAKDAMAYFKRIVPGDPLPYVERLAYYYSEARGDKESARILFRDMIKAKPLAPKSFEYQYQIVQNYFYEKNSPLFKEELFRWIGSFSKQSAWGLANAQNSELIENSYKLQEQTLRNYVLQNHQNAQDSRGELSQGLANEGYNIYIREFPTSPFIGDMHFYYGELLFDMKRYDDAAVQYRKVVDGYPKNKFFDKAATNLLLAFEKSVPEEKDLQRKAGSNLDPIPFDLKSQKFIEAADWFTRKFPKGEKVVEIKFRVGRLHYQHNQFDAAAARFKEIVQSHPKTQQAEFSANLLLDIFNLQKDYIGLEKAGTELLQNEAFANTKAGGEIRTVVERASFKKAQDLEGKKDYLESAKQYEIFAQQNPKSPLALVATFNAGVNFERAGENGKSLQNFNKVIQSNDPEAQKLKLKIRKVMAKLNQDAGRFEEAVKLYSELSKEDPKSKESINFVFNAAVLYEALGKPREALSAYTEYTTRTRRWADKAEAFYAMAEIYRKSDRLSLASRAYEDYLSVAKLDVRAVEAAFHVYTISKRLNRVTKSKEWKAKVLSMQRQLGKGGASTFAAQIKLEETLETFNVFKSIRIPANPQRQKAALDQKIDYLKRINTEIQGVIRFDSANEIVDSLALLGDANFHMYEAIVKTPIPAGLNADETKQYRDGVEGLAKPFQVQAKDSYRACVQRARELEVYNDKYHETYFKILALDPGTSMGYGEAGVETQFLNWTAR